MPWGGVHSLRRLESTGRASSPAEHLALDETMADDFIATLDRDPTLVFLYQHAVDHAGHTYGWGSPEQTNACRHADAQIARVVAALEQRGMAADTAIVLTAESMRGRNAVAPR